MKIDPFTMALCMRAMGMRKLVIRARDVAAIRPDVELQQVMLPADSGIEFTLLEPVIEGERVG